MFCCIVYSHSILDTSPITRDLQKFSSTLSYLFTLLMIFFEPQSFFNFDKVELAYFFLITCAWNKTIAQSEDMKIYIYVFLWKSCGFTSDIKVIDPFYLTLHMEWVKASSSSFCMRITVVSATLVEKTIISSIDSS